MWLFRRRSRRKRGRSTIADAESPLPPRSQTMPEVTMADASPPPQRQASQGERMGRKKLQRRPRAYSFSPDRQDIVQIGRRKSTRTRPEAGTASHNATGTDTYHAANIVGSGVGEVHDDVLRRVPTLHNKRDGDHLPRKRTSKKRRRNGQEREAEIKAMCNFMPVRPAAEDWTAGHPVRKETRKVKTGFGAGFGGADWDKYNRSSDISLPPPGSIDSGCSSDSDFVSYKVSALEVLAPRPTLRCVTHSRSGTFVCDGPVLFRRPSQQRTKLSAPIPEATLKAHKRVDDIADELSARDLRELMERDQRRRARKTQFDQKVLEQKIARRAEKQRAAEAEAARQGRESPPNLERGVLGREDVGLGIDPASAVVTSSRIRDRNDSPRQQSEAAEDDNIEAPQDSGPPHPIEAFHRIDSIPSGNPEAALEPKERRGPAIANSEPKGSLRTRLSRSKSPQESESRTNQSGRKVSEDSNSKGPFWSSLFRWGNKSRRSSKGPSSFSNTSRDSMQVIQTPVNPVPSAPRHLSSGIPKRTMSRFREDLPELPVSPPASRMQSPEAEYMTESSPAPGKQAVEPMVLQPRHDTPASDRRSVEMMRQTPSSDEPGVSPEPQSMSLASIDSEGSWFSGRLSKKRKSSGILAHAPGLRLHRETPEPGNERLPQRDSRHDDMDIIEDDYLSRLTPSHGDRSGWNRKSTGEARPSSDWEEEAHWGSVRGQLPTLVNSHTVERMKSREGLLRISGGEGDGRFEPADSTNDSDEESHEGQAI
ncbi:hypothetical protein VTK26DRAFT_925 [Humicola hyalothermophila]